MNSFKITTFVNNIANFLACSIQDTNTLALLAAIFTQFVISSRFLFNNI